MREKLRKAEAGLAALEGALLVGLLGLMICLAFASVVLRRFGLGLLWGETLLKQLVLLTGFLGAALAAAAEKHFAWEAAHMGAPKALQPWLRLLANLCAAAVCVLLMRAGWHFTLEEKAASAVLFTVGSTAVPAWLFTAGIPAGFLLIAVHALFKTVDAAWDLKR